MTIGQMIREAREAHDMTQTTLGQRVGYGDGNAISQIERGKRLPDPEKIERFIHVLELDPAEFKVAVVDFEIARAAKTRKATAPGSNGVERAGRGRRIADVLADPEADEGAA